jgi:hypothetical protein
MKIFEKVATGGESEEVNKHMVSGLDSDRGSQQQMRCSF